MTTLKIRMDSNRSFTDFKKQYRSGIDYNVHDKCTHLPSYLGWNQSKLFVSPNEFNWTHGYYYNKVPVSSGELHLPHVKNVLVVEEGESLGGAGTLAGRQREHVRGILSYLVRVHSHLTFPCRYTGWALQGLLLYCRKMEKLKMLSARIAHDI